MMSHAFRRLAGISRGNSVAARCFSSGSQVEVDVGSFALHKIDDAGPLSTTTTTREEMMKLFTDMSTIRRMETVASDLYKSKFIRGFCHLYSGQEAVATGIESVMKEHDDVITAYRCHGFAYLRGESVKGVFCELLGRRDGCSKGKGGSMHMYGDRFFGGNGIVGAQVPLGAGLAFAHKYKKDNGVTFVGYGDGAANQGQVFEAYNMAKLWDLPCIFFCENNRYGMGTSQERSSASFNYYTRGDYVPGIQVNGMDVLAVRQACQYATQWARSGKGPLILEMVTYRYGGHSMSDPGTSYRTRDEINQMRAKSDPIQAVRQRMVQLGLAEDSEFDLVLKQIRQAVEEAAAAAKEIPELEVDELYTNVSSVPPEKVRGCDYFTWKHFPQAA